MDKHYVDEEMMVMHESARTLFDIGLISADEMRKFDKDCLVQKDKITPAAGTSRIKPVTPVFTSS